MCLPSTAFTVGALPGNGTYVIGTLVASLSFSKVIWEGLAGPVLDKVNSPGLARAASIKSRMVPYCESLLTKRSCGDWTRLQIGSKPVSASKLSFRKWALMNSEDVWRRSVLPLGAERATTSAPMTVPAPGRSSMTNVTPRVRLICSVITRAMMSPVPPGGYGLTNLMVRGCDNAFCAHRAIGEAHAATSTAAPAALRKDFHMSPSEC